MNIKKYEIELKSISDIMFNRFIDHSKTERLPEESLYLDSERKIVFPSENINAFLFGDNPQGCAKIFEKKLGKKMAKFGQATVFISPNLIPFTDLNNNEIIFNGFENNDKIYINVSSPRIIKGNLSIKSEAIKRPVLKHPWKLNFVITIIENDMIDHKKIYNWFSKGGTMIAIGNYRPRYGRFNVSKFNFIKNKI